MKKNKKSLDHKSATFYLSNDALNSLQPIAEHLSKKGVLGMIDQYGDVNKSAVVNYLIMQGKAHATK